MSSSSAENTTVDDVTDVMLGLIMKAKQYGLINRTHLIEHDIDSDTECFIKFLETAASVSGVLLETIELLEDPRLKWTKEDHETVKLVESTTRSKMKRPTPLFKAFWEKFADPENGLSAPEKLAFLAALLTCCDLLPIQK